MHSIEVKNLRKEFGNFVAVNDISFNVNSGDIFGFLGANGAGKTTAIKMMCGILAPTSGDALVHGFSIAKDPSNVKLNIGYMSQRFSLYNDLSVVENINFFGGVYGLSGKDLEKRKDWVLEIANLKNEEKVLTGSLPGGIKQRLALGTAVIHKPKIVFLDEPTSGVDPLSRRAFWELIQNLSSEGVTVLVTTHYLEEAEYCNDIILMDAGEIIANGSSKVMKEKYLKNDILEIECSDVIAGLEILEKQNFVEETSIFGNNIHISINKNLKELNQINTLLKSSHNIDVIRVQKIVPTLEDVFIHLLEKRRNAK
ncbi:MAG: ABC transporter ATP-binding protein [Melioribacteraceae bacterium]|jgi:ABC-2 type transport system ATP-binding protein|nr:ABC transporter ATP-binding protein [Melioribacteraceae bacterium]